MAEQTSFWMRFTPFIAAIGGFFSIALFLPMSISVIVWGIIAAVGTQIFAEILPKQSRFWRIPTALQLGFFAFYLLVISVWHVEVILVYVSIIFIVWLYVRPGMWPVVAICVLNIATGIYILSQLIYSPVLDDWLFFALHSVYRVLVVGLMINGYYIYRHKDEAVMRITEVFD